MKILDMLFFILKAGILCGAVLLILLILMPDNVINAFEVIKGLLQ